MWNHKVLGIIPARGGKQHLKNKNILPLLGKPVIAYTILAAQKSSLIDRLVVSTEDLQIARIAKSYGVEVINRPSELALDISPIEDSLRHAVEQLEQEEGYFPETVVQMQANIPFRREGMVDKVVSRLISTSADSIATVYEVDQRPQWMKQIDQNGYLQPWQPITNKYRRQEIEPVYLLDGAVIATRKIVLMQTGGLKGIHQYLGGNILGIIQEKRYALEIDSKEDLFLAELLLKRGQ